MRQGDRQTAQACLEQHLHLVQQLGDWQGEITAWSKMAQLAAVGGGASAKGGEEAEGGGGENIGPVGDGNRSGAGAGVAGTIGQDAVARALWCFEGAAALAKTHDEVRAINSDIDNLPWVEKPTSSSDTPRTVYQMVGLQRLTTRLTSTLAGNLPDFA